VNSSMPAITHESCVYRGARHTFAFQHTDNGLVQTEHMPHVGFINKDHQRLLCGRGHPASMIGAIVDSCRSSFRTIREKATSRSVVRDSLKQMLTPDTDAKLHRLARLTICNIMVLVLVSSPPGTNSALQRFPGAAPAQVHQRRTSPEICHPALHRKAFANWEARGGMAAEPAWRCQTQTPDVQSL